jgi:exodeoxyribonuclease-3
MPEERVGLGEFFELGLVDTFRLLHPDTVQYTWWDMVSRARDRNVGWRLDYFMISPNLIDHITSADIHDEVQGSDHCPISLCLSL